MERFWCILYFHRRSFFHNCSHNKIDVALISRGTRNQSANRCNRIIRPLSEVARGGSTKTSQRSSQLSNLRQRIAEIRKFETFDERVQKKGAGDSGNCKTTSAPGINFHNERAQYYAVWQSSSRTRPLFWNIQASSSFTIPWCLCRQTLEVPGRRIPLSRIASSRRIFCKLGHFAGPFRCAPFARIA